ncbi:MAG: DUF87 domain-containing protein [Eubacterium sp.]|nr:DUF87 domain-containing protein [Eubacterium sp.]
MYYIKKIPDLTLSKYQVFADSGIDGLLNCQTQFIRQLHRVALLGHIGIHFFIEYDPDRLPGAKLNICLGFSGVDDDDSYYNKLQKVIQSSEVSRFFYLQEDSCKLMLEKKYTQMGIMHKKERILQTSLNNKEQYFYVVPNWEMNEKARLYSLLKLMQAFDEKCCYRVDLYTEDGIEDQIHLNFEKPLSYLRNISNNERGISELSKLQREKRDPNADETLRQYEDWLKAVDEAPIFLGRICSFSDDKEYSQLMLDSVISESVKSGNGNIIVKSGHFLLKEGIDKYVPHSSEDVPKTMKCWTTTFTLNEVATMMRFPVLYDGETIELPKETAAIQERDGITLGRDVNNYDVKIPLKLMPKHMFVCGVPGAGKTNTMLHLANSFWKEQIPFLVLEPAKREYRELAMFDIPELVIFSPSACTDFPLHLNPFEFPQGLTLSEHIAKLCQVFEGAFPIAPPAPFILDRAIQKVYENHGWSVKDVNTGTKDYPLISELYVQFEKELKTTNYDSEIQGNIRSVLEMRIGSLLRREMKEIFDVSKSTLSPEEWLEHPVIIELEALGEGPANFVTLLLCTLIRETLKVNPLKDKEKPVRHVIFIEEAHNLIAPESQIKEGQDSNPKIAATAFIVKMLAEVRALREGIIIADQLPTAMAPEVIKNTNIKLVHRLTSADDRELVGSTMSASSLQMENMATFTSGQALITYEKLLRPFEMQVCHVEEHGDRTPDDKELFEIMLKKPLYRSIREKKEDEKFRHIKEKVMKIISTEEKCCMSLAGTNLRNMTPARVEDWLRTNVATSNRFITLRAGLIYECEMLSNDFIDEKRKKTLLEIIKKIGTMYEKILRMAAQTV